MALNPSIILSGQPLDVVGAMDRGATAGARMNDIQHTRGYRNALQDFGAGAMQGDQNALAELARFDPAASQNLQTGQLNMDLARSAEARNAQMHPLAMQQAGLNIQATEQNMEMARRGAAQEAAQAAANMSIAEREAAQEALTRVVTGLSAAQTPEQFDRLAREWEMPQYVGRFEDRAQILARVTGSLEGLGGSEFNADQYRVVGSQLIDLAADGGPSAVLTAPGQEEVIYGPDGQPLISRGPVGTSTRLTEGQSKDIGFATRARDALTQLEAGDPNSLSNFWENAAESAPLGLGRYAQSPEFQTADNQGTQFLLAILRKDTGAAVTPSEEQMYGDVFLPRPGDTDEVLAAKTRARELAVTALEEGMGPEQILAQARAIGRVDSAVSPAPTPTTSLIPEADMQQMSTEELQAIINAGSN